MKLVLIGGSRNADDDRLVRQLKIEAYGTDESDVRFKNNIIFEVNASFPLMQSYMKRALIGLHTMWNEHFGICVVEIMAAGMVVLAHKSGGPMMDIVYPASSLESINDLTTEGIILNILLASYNSVDISWILGQ